MARNAAHEDKPSSNPPLGVRYVLYRCLCLVGITMLCLVTGCEKKGGDQPAVIHYTPLPQQTPVHLEVGTIEKFVDWISTMPSSQVPDVKDQIAKVASNAALVDAVASKLSMKPPVSYGRQLIYVSILGETKSPRAVGPLSNYLNSPDCVVFEELPSAKRPVGSTNTSYSDACAGLKSAAVNMIAHINNRYPHL